MQNQNLQHTPVLSQPLPLNWGKLCEKSKEIGSLDDIMKMVSEETERRHEAVRIERPQKAEHPAEVTETQSSQQKNFPPGVPVFKTSDYPDAPSPARPPAPEEPPHHEESRLQPAHPEPAVRPDPAPVREEPVSAPLFAETRRELPPVSDREFSAQILRLEQAIADRLEPVIEAAARKAADDAAARMRTEIMSRIDQIVRDAVGRAR